ncbi:SETD2 methyltransferase, partial [Chaetops frenatus]|nr:SETD2 methyltransferase [Chaetops frenatus]
MSQFIVQCLNPYRKPDCKVGRITTTEDFKHLARKVGMGEPGGAATWGVQGHRDVSRERIKKYMQKFGILYKPKEDTELE